MSRPHVRSAAAPSAPGAPTSPTWAEWPWRVQALQAQAARDMLGVFNRGLAALAAARDVRAVAEVQRTVIGDWMACVEGVGRQWADLTRALPPASLAASGWPRAPAAPAPQATAAGQALPKLLEQSKLGFEMLLRPWVPAPDLEHTDEFVA